MKLLKIHLKTTKAHRGKVELRNTFWLVNWDQLAWKTFDTMIEDIKGTFKIKMSIKKVEMRQVPITVPHTQTIDLSIMLF